MIKAILFDLDDTLYDQLQAFQYAYYRHFADSDIGVERLYRHFRMYSDEVFQATQNGQMAIDQMHIYRISQAVKDFDIALPQQKAMQFQKDYEYAQKHIQLSPTMISLLNQLSETDIKLGVITNGESDRQRAKIQTLELTTWIPDAHILISAEQGATKPDLAIFEKAMNVFSLKKEELGYVGDHFENDIVGASRVGWQTIWFNRRLQPSPQGEGPSYLYVEDESELASVIQQKWMAN
ncbi:HAD family hydrolase [Staphylococcus sp. 11261D007BR]